MFFVLSALRVESDFDAWKQGFDRDAHGRAKTARGFELLRCVEDPQVVYVKTAFDSVVAANQLRDKLTGEGGPKSIERALVFELVDSATYE